jgi:hypothetical protein
MFVVSLISLILLAIVNIGGFSGEGWGAGLLVLILYSLAGLFFLPLFAFVLLAGYFKL